MPPSAQPYLGAHVSAAGGVANAIANAERLGAETIQFFGSSPRQWAVRQPSDEDIRAFAHARETSGVKAAFLHAPYLPNLASSDQAIVEKSIDLLAGHLRIAERLQIDGLIFHVGSGKEIPKDQAIVTVASAMIRILDRVPGQSLLIIENSAGGGEKVCSRPAEFKIIMDEVGSDRVKVCYDTAHGFESGLIEAYTADRITALLDEWEREVGIANIVALHVNDSKTPFNSHHDRHENIGEGHIGLDGFRNLAREKRISHTSWILEVPGFDDQGPDEKNMEILRSCFDK